MYTRIYFNLVKDSLNSDKKLYYTLSYLKLRTLASKRAGFFTFKDAMSTLQNTHKTTLKHLNYLQETGVVTKNEAGYRLLNAKKNNFFGLKNRDQRYIPIEECELLSYNWKTIANFRAMFSEIRNELDIFTIRTVARGFKAKYGESIRIQNRSFSHFDGLYAAGRASFVNNVCKSTAYSYRKKQTLVVYGKQQIERVLFSNGYIKSTQKESLKANTQATKIAFLGKLGYNLKREDYSDSNSPLLFFNPSPRVSSIPSRSSNKVLAHLNNNNRGRQGDKSSHPSDLQSVVSI